MLYFTSPSTEPVRQAMHEGRLGMIVAPSSSHRMVEGVSWCADNGCFGKGYPGDGAYLTWLKRRHEHAARCWFATAPDVAPTGPMKISLERSRPLLPLIRGAGFPVALEEVTLPWDDFDVIFIGGDDDFKLGPQAREVVSEANARGLRVHMGRVNSLRRLRYAYYIGCSSVDGTYIKYGPDINLPRLLRFLNEATAQLPYG
jgi:hypothetical protein